MLIFSVFLFFPVRADAACCKCTHPDIDGTFCIQKDVGNCENLAQHNEEFANADCELETKDASCRKISDSGICINKPVPTLAFTVESLTIKQDAEEPTQESDDQTQFTPALIDLNVDIPNLTFTDPYLQNNQIIIPYLGQYIQAVYKFLLGAGLIATAIMVILGGYYYLMSSTGAKLKQEGKEIIKDSLMGLVILIGAYVILSNVNPNLTKFGALTVPFIEKEPLELISPKTRNAAISGSKFKSSNENIPSSAIYTKAKEIAQKEGIDPCIVAAIIKTESGGQPNAIGHDENFAVNFKKLNSRIPQSRVDFLRSRKFYSGETFDSDLPIYPADCNRVINGKANPAYPTCQELAGIDGGRKSVMPLNDDEFDPSKPDYGLDTRFSHGFGISQYTIPSACVNNNTCHCDGHWSAQIGDTCFTGADLLTVEGGIRAIIENPGIQKNKQNPSAAFWSYIGKKQGNEGLHAKKMAAYQACQ